MKTTNKVIAVLCIILTILAICASVYADGTTLTPDKLWGGNADETGVQEITALGKSIVAVVQTVGVVVAVVILLVLGIKYMMGSAEEKADYKKSMIPYIVGAVLIFASTTIVNIVYNLATGLNNKGNAGEGM